MTAPAVAGRPARRLTFHPAGRARAALVAASLAWAVLLLAIYYARLWDLLAAGPQAWDILDFPQQLRATGLPHVREAALRAGAGAASAALVAIGAFGCGLAADRWLTPSGLAPYERLVVRFGNGAAILSGVLLLLALAGLYRPAVVRAVAIAAALPALLAFVRSRNSHEREREARLLRLSASSPWIVVTLLAAALAFVTALAPEVEYDALWYHLELPRRWLAAGRLTDNVHEYISLYPGQWELLFGAALAFDGSVAARLLHWTTLGAGATAAAAIATRALGAGTGWMAAAIFVTAPTVLWEATTAYVDLALAMHAGLAVGALWQSTRSGDRRWIVLAGIQFGMACATKHLGLVIAAAAIGCYAIARARRDAPARLVRTLMLAGVLTMLIPSPWYARAWLASGNPVFPEMYHVFGARPAERWNDATEQALERFQARFGRPRTIASSLTLPWDMTVHSWRYGGTLGPFLLLVLPAGIALVWREGAARWLLAGAIAYLAVWASPVSSLQLRFLVPWWLFMSVLIAGSIALLRDAAGAVWRPAPAVLHLLLASVAILNLPPFTPLHERDREGWTKWLTHVVHRAPLEVVTGVMAGDAYLRTNIRSYAAWQFLNGHAPAGARVLTFFGGDHFYANRERLWSDAAAARQVTWDAPDADRQEILARLERLGITHLIEPVRAPGRDAEHDRLPLLRPEVLSGFQLEYDDYWARVYRIGAASRGRDTSGPGGSSERDREGASDQR